MVSEYIKTNIHIALTQSFSIRRSRMESKTAYVISGTPTLIYEHCACKQYTYFVNFVLQI